MYSLPKAFLFLFCLIIIQVSVSHGQSSISGTNCEIDSIIVTTPECNSQCTGSVEVFAQGSGPLFYQWPGIPGASTPLVTGLCAGNYVVIIADSTGCVVSDSVVIVEPDPIGFSFSVNNATCPGGCSGSVLVSPFDTVPYTFQWPGYMASGPVLANLCQGTYTVILTDVQGCSVIGSVQVGYDAPFDLSFWSTPASCLTSCDGSATVFANGIPPFSYQWGTGPIQNTQGAVNLCSGNFIVSVTDSTGCVVSDTVMVSQLPPPAISFNTSPPSCFGGCNGQAEVLVAGNGNYAFEWSTFPIQYTAIATGLCSGYQFVVITDLLSGCVFFDSVLVDNPPSSILSFNSVPSYCENFCSGSATVNAFGPGPFSFLWQSGDVSQTTDSLCPGIYAVTVTDSAGCSSTASVAVALQELLFTVTDANCNTICDGVAEVSFPAGSAWQAAWATIPVQNSAVATQLCSGTYVVLITDTSGCQISDSVMVEELQPINAVFSNIPASCPGVCDGSIAAVITGNAPFSILWSSLPGQTTDSVSQLCSGIYPVVITDSAGCSFMDSILVTEPEIPQFSYTTIANSCFNICDASAVIIPDTPGSYTYEWQTTPLQYGASATGLCPEFTMVQVTEGNGCTFIDSVLIIGTPPIYIGTNSVNPSCFGSCDGFLACIVFGGTPGYTYSWSNGYVTPQVLNVCEGAFMVTVTDANGCFDSIAVTLDAPDPIVISFLVTDASCATCADGSVSATVTGGTPNYNYYWTPGGIGTASEDSLAPGTYNLCVADGNLCIECANVVVSFVDALPETGAGNPAVTVFPNPFSERTTISLADDFSGGLENLQIEMYDVWGRKVNGISVAAVSYSAHGADLAVDAGKADAGLYLFKISSGKSRVFTGRLMVQH